MQHYLTTNDDIQSIINNSHSGDVINLSNGVYHQKLIIDKPNITLCGQNRDKTIIEFDDYAKKIHSDGKEYNTFRTFTVNVIAPNVNITNLTISNSALDPINKGQAVALSIYANNVTIDNCNIYSMQDTIFNGPLPLDLIERYTNFLPDNQRLFFGQSNQVIKNCLVCGTVDFIFGCANALYYNCEIRSICDNREVGYVCAPAHEINSEDAIMFYKCNFTASNVKENSIFLARPWRDYGQAIFVDNVIGNHISQVAFDKWNDTNRDKTARFYITNNLFDTSTVVHWAKTLTKQGLIDFYDKVNVMLNK